jgi:stage II sporulation protein D
MHKSWREILLALVLGFLLPLILFSVPLPEKEEEKQECEQTEDLTTDATKNENIYLTVLADDGTVLNLNLEDYIIAVVLREMPASFETEALKAQAVVARTYALRRHELGGKHQHASVCTDSGCCQGYYLSEAYLRDGGSSESLRKVSDAVLSTAGEVLTYNNKLIEATYFSCSGGMTEDAAAVWGAEVPYLVATESPGEENATHYVDTVTLTTSEFARKLGVLLSDKSIKRIENITYTAGGGVEEIQIGGKRYKGTTLRKKLGLRSTAFTISVVGNTVTITTKGFGHRVGMSQYGADAMAVQGNTYEQILAHYYRNTKLITYGE